MTFFRLFVPIFILVTSGVFIIETFGFQQMSNLDPGGPKVLPRLLIVIVSFCAVLELVRFFRTTSIAELKGAFGETFRWNNPESTTARFNSAQRAIIAILLSLVYPMGITSIGFILSTIAFITLIAMLFRAKAWASILTGVVVSILVFFLFAEVMNVRVPEGAWFDIHSILFG